MKLLITGAGGFLGGYAVDASLARGHTVRAMIRPAALTKDLRWADHGHVEIVRGDLRSPAGVVDAVAGVDAVLHLAAAKSGDFYAQFASTVIGTEHLLTAMESAGVHHLVSVSSFAVYDYRRRMTFTRLDESAPLERRPEQRDEYCRTKLLQEQLIRKFASTRGWSHTILRPGVIYGPGQAWTPRLGARLGPRWWLRTGAWAALPLTYVANCAEAVVMAAESEHEGERILNVVDDETPTQRRYARMLQRHTTPRPRIVPVAWSIMRGLAAVASVMNAVCFRGRARVPGIFIPARLHARCKPLRYTNARLRDDLGWMPRVSLREGLERCFASEGESGAAARGSSVAPAAARPITSPAAPTAGVTR